MKKKLICLIMGVFICIGLTACETSGTQSSDNGSTEKIYNSYIYEFVDPDTGVHYWVYSQQMGYCGMGGITPRLKSDGTVMITE